MSEFEKSKMKRRPYGRDSFVKVFLLMNDRRIKLGFSITEVLVVVAIIAVLVGIGVPAAKQMQKSFESTAGVKNAISAALGNARAIALKEGKYAGVRFQQDATGRQYMVLVIHDYPGTGLANGFRVVKGRKPFPLPVNVGVMDLRIRQDRGGEVNSAYYEIDKLGDVAIDEALELTDTMSFSIVFSPAGKLVTHEIRVWNRHGKGDDSSVDDVFNTTGNVYNPVVQDRRGLFLQDDYAALGLGQEMSRKFFVIVIKNEFGKVAVDRRWSDYLMNLEKVYVNPYSGEIIH